MGARRITFTSPRKGPYTGRGRQTSPARNHIGNPEARTGAKAITASAPVRHSEYAGRRLCCVSCAICRLASRSRGSWHRALSSSATADANRHRGHAPLRGALRDFYRQGRPRCSGQRKTEHGSFAETGLADLTALSKKPWTAICFRPGDGGFDSATKPLHRDRTLPGFRARQRLAGPYTCRSGRPKRPTGRSLRLWSCYGNVSTSPFVTPRRPIVRAAVDNSFPALELGRGHARACASRHRGGAPGAVRNPCRSGGPPHPVLVSGRP
jgi:hypothetical protein